MVHECLLCVASSVVYVDLVPVQLRLNGIANYLRQASCRILYAFQRDQDHLT